MEGQSSRASCSSRMSPVQDLFIEASKSVECNAKTMDSFVIEVYFDVRCPGKNTGFLNNNNNNVFLQKKIRNKI